ncbi:MAG: hypothetical protein ABII02_04915 [Candidatus Magasanikbacteria bacterium]
MVYFFVFNKLHMRSSIEMWNSEDIQGQDLEKSVLNKDAVSREEIRNYAKMIAEEFKSEALGKEEKRLLALDMLGKDRMLRRLDTSQVDLSGLSEEEMESALKPIREALLEELSNHLESDEFALIKRDIANSKLETGEQHLEQTRKLDDKKGPMNANRIAELLRPKSKRNREQVYRTGVLYEDAKIETKQAITHAHEILAHAQEQEKENNGHYFSGVIQEERFDPISGESVVRKIEMSDMSDLIMNEAENGPGPQEASHILKLFSDAIEACAWLEEKGLMLEDIKPANIGLTEDARGNKRVIFHDLDGLHPIGTKDRLATYSGGGFEPPEFENREMPITSAKKMVFQLGVSMLYTFRLKKQSFSEHVPRDTYIKILDLVQEMVERRRHQRPDLKQCKSQIDALIEEIGIEGLQLAA